MPKEEVNEVCRDCLKWHQFGKECWVWWRGKKFCSMRVATREEWRSEEQVLGKQK